MGAVTARTLFAELVAVGAVHTANAQVARVASWDSLRMTYEPFCQIGTCTGYRLMLAGNRQFTVRGTGNAVRREMAQQRFENVTTLIAAIAWQSLPPSILGNGYAKGFCVEIMTHEPSYTVELFQVGRVTRIVDSHWCTSVRNVEDSDRTAAASFSKLRMLESVLGTIPDAQAAASPTTAPLDYRRIAGCYALTLGEWSVPTTYLPPPTFNLKTTGPDTSGDGTIFRSVAPNPSTFGQFSPAWGIHARGPVEVFWSTGFAGVRLSLWFFDGEQGRPTLEGRADVFADVETPGMKQPTASAKAQRVTCPAG